MIYIFIGLIGFLIFGASDYLTYKYPLSRWKLLFFLGAALVIFSTVKIIPWKEFINIYRQYNLKMRLMVDLAVISLLLLMHSLFFIIPLKKNYIASGAKFPLVEKLEYSLCRHPGVWFLGIFYFMLWRIFEQDILLYIFISFTVADIIYVSWQDKILFLQTIEDYEDYKKRVPFLIPNIVSIKSFLKQIKK